MQKITKAQAVTLDAFFSGLRELLRSNVSQRACQSKQEVVFSDTFLPVYSLAYGVSGWRDEMAVISSKPTNFEYNEETTEGFKKMIVANGLTKFMTEHIIPTYASNPTFATLPKLAKVIAALESLVANREAAQVAMTANYSTAQQFANELFSGFDFAHFEPTAIEFGYIARTKDNTGNQLFIEVDSKQVQLRVFNSKTNMRENITLLPEQGKTAAALKEQLTADWQKLLAKMAGKNQAATGDLAKLQTIDRKMTDGEAKFMSALLTLSDMGQPASFVVTDGNFKLEQERGESLTSLNSCYWVVNQKLENLMESDEIAEAISSEKAEWNKAMLGKTKEKYTLASVSKIWPDLLPLCLWFALNNK